jgi:hypothetical protein
MALVGLFCFASTSSALIFQFETIAVKNGDAQFDARISIDDVNDFYASGMLQNERDFISIQTDNVTGAKGVAIKNLFSIHI